MQVSRFSRLFVRTFLALLVVAAVAVTAEAAKYQHVTAKTKLQIGDKVQYKHFDKWLNAEIIGISNEGRTIEVKFVDPTFKRVRTWPASRDDLRIAVKTRRTGGKGNPFDAGTGNPFEPDKGFRTWQDDTGAFKIEAELAGIEDNAVRLKRRDGRVVTVPLDRLCENDRQLIKRLQGKGEEEEEGEEGEEGEEESSEDGEEEDEFVDDLPSKQPQLEGAETVFLSLDAKLSGVEPDNGPAGSPLTRRVVTLPQKTDFFDQPRGLFVAAASPNQIMIPFAKANEHDQPTRVVLCDLKLGTPRARSLAFSANAVALDIGPAGDQILSHPNGFGFGKKGRVDLWRIQGNKLEHQFGWKPYAKQGHGGNDGDVDWGAFVDAEHVLTLSSTGKLILWKLPDAQAVYTVDLCEGVPPALSPGRKYLAALTDVGVVVLDAKNGDVKGTLPTAEKRGAVVFRPDGKQIALATPSRLMVWEFADGKLYRDIGLTVKSPVVNHFNPGFSQIAWPSKDYILVGGRFLVDLPKYSVLWDYQGGEAAGSVNRQFWCLCGERNALALVPLPLPHPGALTVAGKIKPEDTRGIEPGATVSLEVNVVAPPERQQQIQEWFQEQLKERGMKVGPGSPYKLVVTTKLGEVQQMEYEKSRGFFPRPPTPFGPRSGDGQSISFQTQVSQVAFVIDGQEAWETSSIVGAPGFVQLQEGETTEQAVRKFEKPDLDFFAKVQIPSYVPRPRDTVTFGASKLTPRGLIPAEIQRKQPAGQPAQPPQTISTERQV